MTDMLAAPTLAVAQTRNPFVGKGLRVSLGLLLHPRPWGLRELAVHAQASPALVSMVVSELVDRELIDGAVVQGRAANVRGTRRLAREVALHWPQPRVGVIGRFPSDGPVGGEPAHRELGIVAPVPPRRYVRSVNEARSVLGFWGGALVSPEVGDYELCIVDIALPNGLVPGIIVALELGGTARGRETLDAHADALLGELE